MSATEQVLRNDDGLDIFHIDNKMPAEFDVNSKKEPLTEQ